MAVKNGDVHSILFHSIIENEIIAEFNFEHKISDIQSNNTTIAIGLKEICKIVLINNSTLKKRDEEIICWKESDDPKAKPIFSLGAKFLAFQTPNTDSELQLSMSQLSDSEDAENNLENYGLLGSNVKTVANNVVRNAIYTGSKIYNSFIDANYSGKSIPLNHRSKYGQPGFVQIMDIDSQTSINFFAAESKPLSTIKFDRSGLLILTSPDGSQTSNIWPVFFRYKNQKPFYTLYHGVLFRKIKDVHFNNTSTLVSILSKSGSVHVYPIQPNGGNANAYTHLEKKRVMEEFTPKNETGSTNELVRIYSKGSMCSFMFPYPIRRGSSEKKKALQNRNQCCLIFNTDCTLSRYDLELKREDSMILAVAKESLKWDISKIPQGDLNFWLDSSQKKHESINILSNIETVTFYQKDKHWNKSQLFKVFTCSHNGGLFEKKVENNVEPILPVIEQLILVNDKPEEVQPDVDFLQDDSENLVENEEQYDNLDLEIKEDANDNVENEFHDERAHEQNYIESDEDENSESNESDDEHRRSESEDNSDQDLMNFDEEDDFDDITDEEDFM